MGRITVDVNEEWLVAAQQELGTKTKVATINGALQNLAERRHAKEMIEVLDSITMDFTGSADAFRYGGGRDLSRLEEDARQELNGSASEAA
ncbi:MAG: type II toxin-antitoxin system VapB family antitoxin [Stackebrandtia sp.]